MSSRGSACWLTDGARSSAPLVRRTWRVAVSAHAIFCFLQGILCCDSRSMCVCHVAHTVCGVQAPITQQIIFPPERWLATDMRGFAVEHAHSIVFWRCAPCALGTVGANMTVPPRFRSCLRSPDTHPPSTVHLPRGGPTATPTRAPPNPRKKKAAQPRPRLPRRTRGHAAPRETVDDAAPDPLCNRAWDPDTILLWHPANYRWHAVSEFVKSDLRRRVSRWCAALVD